MPSIGPYELLNELGRGGAGVVFRARDARSGREVALKLLGRDRVADPVARGRFSREVAALTRLRHPAIVPVIEAGEHQGQPWLAMELVPGESLATWLERHGPFEPRVAAGIVRDLAFALEAAHARGLLHRDVKPANVLRTSAGKVVLGDFGLTKDLSGQGLPGAGAASLSQSGQFLGTPGYWAPEQAAGDRDALGPEVDVWGLGATLYALLTASAPLAAGDLIGAVTEAERGLVVPPSARRPGLPAGLEAICLRCLQREPAARYASTREVAADLVRFLAGRAPLGRRGGASAGRRAVVAGVVVAVIAAAVAIAAIARSTGAAQVQVGGPPGAPDTPVVAIETSTPATVGTGTGPEPAARQGTVIARVDASGTDFLPACARCRPGADPRAELESLRLLEQVRLRRTPDALTAVAWSPDGRRLLLGWKEGHVELLESGRAGWRTVSDTPMFAAPAGLGLSWSLDGELVLVTGLTTTNARLFRMERELPRPAGQLLRKPGSVDFGWVSLPVFLPPDAAGQRLLACAARPGLARTWLQEVTIGAPREDGRIPVGERRLSQDADGPIAVSRDGRWLAVVEWHGRPTAEGTSEVADRFALHDLSGELRVGGAEVRGAASSHPTAVAIDPEGRCWSAITSDRRLLASHCRSGDDPKSAAPHDGDLEGFQFVSDGRHAVSWSSRRMSIWRTWTWPWDPVLTIEVPGQVFRVVPSPVDGRLLVLEPAGLAVYELLTEPAK